MRGWGILILGNLLFAGRVHGMDPAGTAPPGEVPSVVSTYLFIKNPGEEEQALSCPPCLENGSGCLFVDLVVDGKVKENPILIPCGEGPACLLAPGTSLAVCLVSSSGQDRLERYITVSEDGFPRGILHLRMDPVTHKLSRRWLAPFLSKKKWPLVRVRGF
jgi:hypothetical protein